MNQNCTCGTTVARLKLSLNHPDIVYDKRAAFVESVCAVLNESRFGPGRTGELVVNLSERPEMEEAVFFDWSDGEMVPSYALSPEGRLGHQVVEAGYRKARQMGLVGPPQRPHNSNGSPSCLARGSP